MTAQEPDAVDAALLERYRQASSAEGLEPTEAVRAAILAEGRRIAQQRLAAPPLSSFDTSRPAANQSRFRLAAYGTFGVAMLAALLIVPGWLTSPGSRPPLAQTRTALSAEKGAAAPKIESETAADAPRPAETPAAAPAPPPARSEPSPKSTAAVSGRMAAAADSSNAVQPAFDSVTAARTAQNRNYAASAGAAPPPAAASSQPPLMAAVAAGDLARAAALLDQHASTEDRDDLGRTPLLVAATEGQIEIVRLLLAHGADPNVVDKTGATALQRAKRSQFTEVVRLLEDAGAR